MQRRIEAQARSQSALPSIPRTRPSEEVGLGALPQARFRELFNRIFLAILVDSQVDSAEGAAADLLLDQILVDAVLGGAVILAVAVLGARVERFFDLSCGGRCPAVVSEGALVSWS